MKVDGKPQQPPTRQDYEWSRPSRKEGVKSLHQGKTHKQLGQAGGEWKVVTHTSSDPDLLPLQK